MPIPTQQQFEEFSRLSPQAKREVCKEPRNFLMFFSYFFFEYIKYPFAPFHEDFEQDLVDLLEGRITELVWCTARDTAKTSFTKAWAIWLFANKKRKYYNQTSYDDANSDKFLFDCIIEMQTNNRLKEVYGDLFNAPAGFDVKQSKRVGDFITTTGTRVEAHTTQQSVRGRLHQSNRPDWYNMDDFETLKTVRSEAATREVNEHISELKGGIDQKDGRIHYLCNYISETANVAKLKKRAEQDPMLRFREVWRIGDDGKPTWPTRDVLTNEELKLPSNEGKVSIEAVEKSMWSPETGDSDFQREMMGKPVDPMGDGPDQQGFQALIPKDKIKITNDSFGLNAPYAIGVDPAGEGIDESVIVVRSEFQAMVYATEQKSSGKSLAKLVIEAMVEYNVPDTNVVVDAFGVGFKCVKQLALLGNNVLAVNVGEKEIIELEMIDGYLNDRSYAYFLLRNWLADGGELCYTGKWLEQLKCIRFRTSEKGIRQIIPKKEIIKRGKKSPDHADALMLSMLVSTMSYGGKVTHADENLVSRHLG